MTPADLDALCAKALASIKQHINRTAAQQLRSWREQWILKGKS